MFKETLKFSIYNIFDIQSDQIVDIEFRNENGCKYYIFGVYFPAEKFIEIYMYKINCIHISVNVGMFFFW